MIWVAQEIWFWLVVSFLAGLAITVWRSLGTAEVQRWEAVVPVAGKHLDEEVNVVVPATDSPVPQPPVAAPVFPLVEESFDVFPDVRQPEPVEEPPAYVPAFAAPVVDEPTDLAAPFPPPADDDEWDDAASNWREWANQVADEIEDTPSAERVTDAEQSAVEEHPIGDAYSHPGEWDYARPIEASEASLYDEAYQPIEPVEAAGVIDWDAGYTPPQPVEADSREFLAPEPVDIDVIEPEAVVEPVVEPEVEPDLVDEVAPEPEPLPEPEAEVEVLVDPETELADVDVVEPELLPEPEPLNEVAPEPAVVARPYSPIPESDLTEEASPVPELEPEREPEALVVPESEPEPEPHHRADPVKQPEVAPEQEVQPHHRKEPGAEDPPEAERRSRFGSFKRGRGKGASERPYSPIPESDLSEETETEPEESSAPADAEFHQPLVDPMDALSWFSLTQPAQRKVEAPDEDEASESS